MLIGMNEEISAEEFEKIAKNNPNAIAEFASYYKYYFNFIVEMENAFWLFSVGGDSDDIYRLEVSPETTLEEILSGYTPQFIKKFKHL